MSSPSFSADRPLRVCGFILAAGLGTRISALSRHRPKPLLPVGRTSAFAAAIAQLRAGGIERIVANASHLASQLRDAGARLGVEVVEEVDGPLGTAGGLAACADRLGFSADPSTRPDVVVVWNGDIFATFDVSRLCARLASEPRCDAVLVVSGDVAPGVGNVGLDADGRVVRLRDVSFTAHEGFAPEARSTFFSALHAMRVDVAREAPARGGLIEDLYLPALARGAFLATIPFASGLDRGLDAPWFDIGDLDSYLRANLATLDGASAWIGDGARVSTSVTLDRVVVGAGATVEGEGTLRDAVVWPGARIVAPRTRVVAVDGATVVPIEIANRS